MQHKRTAAHQRKAHAGKGGRSQRRLDHGILRDTAFQQNRKPAREQFGMTARDRHDAAFAGIEGDRRDMGCGIAPVVVGLDRCRIRNVRRQQVGEAWFSDISEVPRQAISMSIRQILKAKEIIAVVPDARKALAVKLCLEGEISPLVPASILRTHPATTLYLDKQSASLLSQSTLAMHAAI